MNRPDYNEYFMRMAHLVATRSTCLEKQVGCVLVSEDMRVLSCGYNGAPAKAEHCIDLHECAKDQGFDCRAVHAEINALQYNGHNRPARCYCTLEPCKDCARMLRNAGVSAVYYANSTSQNKSGSDVFHGFWKQIVTEPVQILDKVRVYHGVLGYPDTNGDKFKQGREIALAMFMEMAEVVNAFDWKPWKAYGGKPNVDHDNLLEELVDIMFFIDSMLLNFNGTWQNLFKRMNAKLNENYNRINEGYHK